MPKIAYFDMFSGVSGDMILGALIDNGWPEAELHEVVRSLGLEDEVKLEVSREIAHGIQATRVNVLAGGEHDHHHHHHHHHHRGLHDIETMIDSSSLPAAVKELAKKIFQRLGRAEAAVHGVDLQEIHFHEVGALDSIVDIVGAAAGFAHLGVGRGYASPFRFGTGFVEFSHGRLALPVPAVASLTLGCPSERTTVPAELTTPTGAAIVTTLVAPEDFSPARPLAFDSVGHGLGSRTLADRPNMLRLFIGEQPAEEQPAGDEVVALECNLDDMQPEYFDYLIEKLFEAGALDVWLSPAQMKKNRPGVCLHVLGREDSLGELARLVFLHSSGIGLRWQRMRRLVLEREAQKIATPWGELSVKAVRLPGGGVRRKPEYDELRAMAARSGLPILELARRVEALLND
ncbi:nickel pincer cofactor biosynthesis protein LarC [bacterium]|nr:nickel pincer cofactor biosynthesis protein LarC [bacterium]